MRCAPAGWKLLAPVAAAVVACTGELPEGGDVAAPPRAETAEALAPLEAPAAAPFRAPIMTAPAAASTQEPSNPAAPTVPLEMLLRIPGAAVNRSAEPDMNEVLRRDPAATPSGEEASDEEKKARARKVRLDVGVRTDEPIERRGLKREQVDAGAAVDVRKDTSIKGGVRIERDSSGGVESKRSTTPTVGIEKRF